MVAIFHYLYLRGKISYQFINIIFLVIAPAGYIYRERYSYLFLIGLWSFFLPTSILVYKIDALNAALPLSILSGLLIGFMRMRKTLKSTLEDRYHCLRGKLKDKEKVSEEFEKLAVIENGIREKELTIVSLYEITKKMSANLKLGDIFDVFSAFLKENLTFRKSELIILRHADMDFRFVRTYKTWGGEGSMSAGECNVDYAELTKLFDERKTEFYLTRREDSDIFEKLRIEEAVKTFAAVPLLSENKLVGILTVEDLPFIDFERVAILAMQFSLEIKKVLLYEMVEELAITDSLTGLYVRRYFFERFDEELNRSARYKFKFACLMMDIDDFKKCNDTYGHLVGDVVLKEIAAIIKQNTREIDLAGRYGGEEFSLILPETERDGAYLVAERIRKKVEENVFKAYDEKLKITISIGVAFYPKDSNTAEELIEKADEALYKAKRSGKNIVCMSGK